VTLMYLIDLNFKPILTMDHLKKALIDTIIMSVMIIIIAAFQKSSESITRALIPIAGIACYNFIKAAFRIYRDKKKNDSN
jgi:hypothetical protein